MPLTHIEEPGEVDAFGVRFAMDERGERVACHVFKTAICAAEGRWTSNDGDLLAMFAKNRSLFEMLAGKLRDAGHRTPWIEPFSIMPTVE